MSSDEVIGRVTDLLPDDYKPLPAPEKNIILPVVSFEELEKPSPQPFKGRPCQRFPELDSLEDLYAPKYLLRAWGREKCARSAFWALWKTESERAIKTVPDLKPSEQKKKR